MLGTLFKKEMMEIFRAYFYDAKKNKRRSTLSTIMFIVFYVAIMVGLLGGIFFMLAGSMCEPLAEAGVSWLYFLIFSLMSIALGAFGSVFNTFSALYLSKDNDLLLSLPIPVSSIMLSRLLGVYTMGLMYSAVVIVPAVLFYWLHVPVGVAEVMGSLLLVVLISVIVFILSCILGWAVARVSLRMKNRSFVTVAASLVFIVLYYTVYFKAQLLIQKLTQDAVIYGNRIKGNAYPLYLFGRIGEGDALAMLIYTLVLAVLLFAAFHVMSKSFIGIVTATGKTKRIMYKERAVRRKDIFSAMLAKEFGRFTSSPTYMLNCGLGIIMLPLAGIFLMIKWDAFIYAIGQIFYGTEKDGLVLLSAMVCVVAAMNDMAAPSVSLEGKSLWLVQSLPVSPWQALKAKLSVQIILTGIPMLFCIVCAAVKTSAAAYPVLLLGAAAALCFVVFDALLALFLGLKLPNLTWTNETAPVKQSLGVLLAMFGGFIYALAILFIYMRWGRTLGAELYLVCVIAVTVLFSAVLYLWLKRRGSVIFAEL